MKRSGLKNARELHQMYNECGFSEVSCWSQSFKKPVYRHGQVMHWENSLNIYNQKSVLAMFTLQLMRLKAMEPDAQSGNASLIMPHHLSRLQSLL